MSICPHCQKNTINPILKIWSDSTCPIRCQNCFKLSYLPSHKKTLLSIIAYGGGIPVLGVILLTKSLISLFILCALWFFVLGYLIYLEPLAPISEEQATKNKQNANFFIILLIIAGLIIWYFYND